jgi:hypothetical protein
MCKPSKDERVGKNTRLKPSVKRKLQKDDE